MTEQDGREDTAVADSAPARDNESGLDRAGVGFWNRERTAEGNGKPTLRSTVKLVLDAKSDRMFRSLLAPVRQGGLLLEIGCGPGWLLARLGRIRPDLELHGIDYAPPGVSDSFE